MYGKNHIKIAHDHWKKLLLPDDNVIDATCGNGKDTLFLTKCVHQGKIFCFDIQKRAIDNTINFLKKEKSNLDQIFFINSSHEDFSQVGNNPIKLIVYNLGYLPGGDKTLTTKTKTTLKSIKNALDLVCIGGAVSITCYPGHYEGLKEEKAVIHLLKEIKNHQIFYHKNMENETAPSFFWIKKN